MRNFLIALFTLIVLSGPSFAACMPVPSACDYPDATNTGPVTDPTIVISNPGQSGYGWRVDQYGALRVDGYSNGSPIPAGTQITISNKIIYAPVEIYTDQHPVTIVNSIISHDGHWCGVCVRGRNPYRVWINRNRIVPRYIDPDATLLVGVKDINAGSANLQVTYNDISGASTGIQMEAGIVKHNYVHDIAGYADEHFNGFTSNGLVEQLLTIEHNTFLNPQGQTDAISLFQDFGFQKNRMIRNNLMAGGGYCLYGGQNPGAPATANIDVINNRFSRHYFSNCGFYGPVAAWNAAGAGNSWSGNVWDDTGAAVLP